MADKRPKPPSVEFFTPRGEFIFPSLLVPSTKFPKKGVDAFYECTTRFVPESFPAETLAKLVALRDNHAKKLREDYIAAGNGAAAKKVNAIEVFGQDIVKATGEPTGLVKVNAKKAAYGTKKDGTPWKGRKPEVFDAYNNAIPVGTPIWGGSEGIVKVEATAYDMPTGVVGVKYELLAAQVLKIVSNAQPKSAAQHGFQPQAAPQVEREPGSDDSQGDDDIAF